ncbi:hypothetical protein AKJ36_02325 [candidate division MSBL1 archaeon SCGC-AAA259I07]|uniref:Tyr recombinase domain-containing protein n=1 Tax=candidate division MSBL1 archaeon SCGC-AAA259I07 TaxID=1698266 RepID=A0A133UKI5_9EURY|nr:hypothetical protein AKJ36_02325 [candidate division MSBL1 archaeon SCGC-AAA259I07]
MGGVIIFESALRAHEFLALNLGSIEFEGKMARLILPGADDQRYKTGQRRVPLADSVPYLKEWLNHHPSGEKGDPLWTSFGNGYLGERLSHRGLHSFVKKIARRAEVDKNVYPPSSATPAPRRLRGAATIPRPKCAYSSDGAETATCPPNTST